MSGEIIPSACVGALISVCMGIKACKTLDLDVEFKAKSITEGFGKLAAGKLLLIDLDSCIVDAITTIFAEAGCPLPVFDPNSLIPDLAPCLNILNQINDSISKLESLLGPFENFINLELNSSGDVSKILLKDVA